MLKLIVVDQPHSWDITIPETEIVSSDEYLSNPRYFAQKNIRFFNLSDHYKYQSKGYYVSLMAQARGHRPLPDVKNIVDFNQQSLTKILSEELEKLINKQLRGVDSDHFRLSVYFGKNTEFQYGELAKELYRLFHAPFLRAYFLRGKKGWQLTRIKAIALKDIPANHLPLMKEFAGEFLSKRAFYTSSKQKYLYDLAVLINPNELEPPSNKGALQKLISVGEKNGFYIELISPQEFNRLLTFDALFVRMTTHVHNASYKFVRKAEAEDLAVVDYSDNILKCSNKVYMAELLKFGHVPIPQSTVLYYDTWEKDSKDLKFPCILKLPDSAFSFGVKRANHKSELMPLLKEMFKTSDLIIAQEFLFTPFDWRVGILDNEPIFVCKYYMAKGHWQIYNWNASSNLHKTGDAEAIDSHKAPQKIIETAIKAAALFNKKGLFGVDLKEINGKVYVIEVNDNPNIDNGCEDGIEKDLLYTRLLNSFKKRIEGKFRTGHGKN